MTLVEPLEWKERNGLENSSSFISIMAQYCAVTDVEHTQTHQHKPVHGWEHTHFMAQGFLHNHSINGVLN